MNKQELIQKYHQFLTVNNLLAEDVVVGAGGVMCLLGLREQTEDIDVDVPKDIFDHFAAGGYPSHMFGDVKVIGVTDYIDLHLRTNTGQTVLTDGVCHYTPEVTLAFKRRLNRPKDQSDIAALERYLAA